MVSIDVELTGSASFRVSIRDKGPWYITGSSGKTVVCMRVNCLLGHVGKKRMGLHAKQLPKPAEQ